MNFTRFEQHYWETYGETFSDVRQRVFGNKNAKALFSQELGDIISVKLNTDGMMMLKLRQGATASREPRHFPAAEPVGTSQLSYAMVTERTPTVERDREKIPRLDTSQISRFLDKKPLPFKTVSSLLVVLEFFPFFPASSRTYSLGKIFLRAVGSESKSYK